MFLFILYGIKLAPSLPLDCFEMGFFEEFFGYREVWKAGEQKSLRRRKQEESRERSASPARFSSFPLFKHFYKRYHSWNKPSRNKPILKQTRLQTSLPTKSNKPGFKQNRLKQIKRQIGARLFCKFTNFKFYFMHRAKLQRT